MKCIGNDLQVPARAEIVLEGVIHPNETALEGPYGDHTGYYNEQDHFPVFTVERITMRENPIYHSTYTGKPPDEPAVLGVGVERSVRYRSCKNSSPKSPISTCRPKAVPTAWQWSA